MFGFNALRAVVKQAEKRLLAAGVGIGVAASALKRSVIDDEQNQSGFKKGLGMGAAYSKIGGPAALHKVMSPETSHGVANHVLSWPPVRSETDCYVTSFHVVL
jgi:hypothetical protein